MRRKFSKTHKRIAVAIAVAGLVLSVGLGALLHSISWPMMGVVFTIIGVWSVRDHARSFGELEDQ